MIQSIIDARIPQPTVTNQVLVWNNTTGLFEASVSLSGLTLNSPVIAGAFSWTGDEVVLDCTDLEKAVELGETGEFSFRGINGSFLDIVVFPSQKKLAFGNTTDNPPFNFLGTALTTLGGSLLVNGGFIGDTDDDELIGIDGAGGIVSIDGNIDLPDTTSPLPFGIITKDGVRFMHNFKHSTGSTAIPFGGNVFLGCNAGNLSMGSTATSIDQASRNNGIGLEACQSITLGQKNNGVGALALKFLESGDENNAMGYAALRQLIGGNSNCAVGSLALLQNRNGGDNTAVGTNAGQGVGADSPSGNTFIGYRAGYRVEDAANNICIGRYAGSRIADEDSVLLVSNQIEASFANEQLNAILYGLMDGDPANQTLRINATTEIGNGTTAQDLVVTGDVSGATLTAGDGFSSVGTLQAYTTFTIVNGIITNAV